MSSFQDQAREIYYSMLKIAASVERINESLDRAAEIIAKSRAEALAAVAGEEEAANI